jgi:succinoglycan biosynthesis protein ExoA
MVRYGRGRMRLLRKHPETFSPLGFTPALFVAFVLLGPWGLLFAKAAGWLYAAGLLTYVGLVAAFSIVLALRARRVALSALLPVVFVTLHAGAGCGILLEAIRPKRHAPANDFPERTVVACEVTRELAAHGADE